MYTNIPEVLKKCPNWVVWKAVVKNGQLSKEPYVPSTGYHAKADDPSTWTTFDNAVHAADPLNGGEYDGIGFEFLGTSFIGVDFDNSINAKGVVDPYVLAILELLKSPYTEISPSRKGLHAFVEGDALPDGGRKFTQGSHTGIEIYHGREGGRYFTVTGERVLGAGVPRVDINLPYLLITQNKDKKFKNLWLGDTSFFDGDESTADFALLCRLATLTNNNATQMEEYFGKSELGKREKWIGREDYRDRTIKKIIKAAIETNRSGKTVLPIEIDFHTPEVPDPNGEYVISPVEGQEDGWFPLGDISLVGGASGTGKTSLIFEMLHKQKQGYPFLGHTTFKRLFHVFAYDRGKNAFERTMRRLRLNNMDIPTTPLPLAFGTNAVQNIINEIEKLNPLPQIVFIEGMDMLLDDTNKKSLVSPFMRQLQEVAAHFHIALIGSLGAPKTKRGEDYAAKRDHLSGSEAWGRNCETVAILEFSDEDDGTAPQRELTILPRNAMAEKFSLQFEGGRLIPVQATPEKEPQAGTIGRPSKELQTAISFLTKYLQDGQPKGAKEMVTLAHDLHNISRSTLYNAADAIHVKKGPRGITWELSPINEIGNASDVEEEKLYTA